MTYYELLGVAPTASVDQIHRAYRHAVLRYHPDVNKAPNAAAVTMRLNEAWRTLGESASRADYDRRIGFGARQFSARAQERPAEPYGRRSPGPYAQPRREDPYARPRPGAAYTRPRQARQPEPGPRASYRAAHEQPYGRSVATAPSLGLWLAGKLVSAALHVVVIVAFIAFVVHSFPLVATICGAVFIARMFGRPCR